MSPSDALPSRLLAGVALAALAVTVHAAPAALGSNRMLPWAYNALAAGCALALAVAHAALGEAGPRGAAHRDANHRQNAPSPAAHLAPGGPRRQDAAHGGAHYCRNGQHQRAHVAPGGPALALPLGLLVVVMGWIAVQALAPAPAILVHPVWAEIASVSKGLGSDLTPRISVNPEATLLGLQRLATATAVGLAAFVLAREPARARWLVDMFVIAATAYALYGLVRLALMPGKVLWFDAPRLSVLTGPFLGRNQAATYYALAAIAAFAVLMQDVRRLARSAAASSLRYQIVLLLGALPSRLGLRLAALVLLFAALLLTGSRAGIAFGLTGLGGLLLFGWLRRAGARSGGAAARLLFVALIALLVLVLFEVAGARIAGRLMAEGLEPGARPAVYRLTIAAILDHPLWGTGYATFQDVFPLYRVGAGSAHFTWDKAHGDYLELALGLGLPAAALFLAALAALFAATLRGALRRRRDHVYPTIAAAATIVVGLHALVDFSLQIQAIALAYAMLLGVGLAQSTRRTVAAEPRRQQGQSREREGTPHVGARQPGIAGAAP